jgi:hypothetical protein
MAPSRFRSATSVALASVTLAGVALASVTLVGAAGCSDDGDSCGPGNAPAAGLVASAGAVTLTYGQLISRPGNDCPTSGAPAGVVSLTIEATQTDGTGLFTLCVGRPDLLARQAQALGGDTAGVEVRLIDFTGAGGGCSFALDRSQPITGTATSTGMCGNGEDAAGFALTVNGSASLTRTCGATVDAVTVAIQGRVAVDAE